jgi:hypothetical protein
MEDYGDYDEQKMEELAIRYPDYNEMDTNELDTRISTLNRRTEESESSGERLDIKEEVEYAEELMRRRSNGDDDASYYTRWRATIIAQIGEKTFEASRRKGETDRELVDRILYWNRKGKLINTICQNEVARVKRLMDWALEKKIPLAAALVAVAAAATAIGILCRKLLEKGASTTAKAADTTNSASKELPPAVEAIMAVVVKSLDTAGDLLIWLASNLWAVAAAVAVYMVSR